MEERVIELTLREEEKNTNGQVPEKTGTQVATLARLSAPVRKKHI